MVFGYYHCRGTCLSVLITFLAFASANSPTFAQAASKNAHVTYEVFFEKGSGYGYDIFVDGKKLIHQPNIPGIAGTAGFKTKEDSRRVAEMVVKKLKNGEVPPSITLEELRQLKVVD